ncbi:unnamed protein product, partial [Prorocentrum cordatum]
RQTVARMRSRLRAAAGDAPRQAQPSLLPGRWLRLHRYTDTGTEVPYIYDVANAAVIEMDIEASMRAGALELCQTEERVQRFSESRATKETPPKAKSVRFPHEDRPHGVSCCTLFRLPGSRSAERACNMLQGAFH